MHVVNWPLLAARKERCAISVSERAKWTVCARLAMKSVSEFTAHQRSMKEKSALARLRTIERRFGETAVAFVMLDREN